MVMGRPKKCPSHMKLDGWDLIEAIIPFASEEYLAFRLGMSIETLNKRIKEEKGMTFLEYKNKKKEMVKISVMQKQFEIAMEGNPSMNIWLGKQYAGQSDKQETNLKSETGIKVSFEKDTD